MIAYTTLDYRWLAAGNSTETNLIGASNSATGLQQFMSGKLDDLALWDRVLTPSEIAWIAGN